MGAGRVCKTEVAMLLQVPSVHEVSLAIIISTGKVKSTAVAVKVTKGLLVGDAPPDFVTVVESGSV
ncbi:hypothetical protein D3C87_1935260 [compost metagenome]